MLEEKEKELLWHYSDIVALARLLHSFSYYHLPSMTHEKIPTPKMKKKPPTVFVKREINILCVCKETFRSSLFASVINYNLALALRSTCLCESNMLKLAFLSLVKAFYYPCVFCGDVCRCENVIWQGRSLTLAIIIHD